MEFFTDVAQPVRFAGRGGADGLAYRVYDPDRIVAGALPASLLALAADVGLTWLGTALRRDVGRASGNG